MPKTHKVNLWLRPQGIKTLFSLLSKKQHSPFKSHKTTSSSSDDSQQECQDIGSLDPDLKYTLLDNYTSLNENVTSYQVKQARKLAKLHGPGNIPKRNLHIVCELIWLRLISLPMRPYFYQDVAYGSRKLLLDTGEKISRSTMVQHY